MKFLCDQMLLGLARWLRAAGHDTEAITQSTPDKKIVEQAKKEERWLITRDRKLLEIRDAQRVTIWLKSNSTEDCAQELNSRLDIDWTEAPFSRCMLCNAPLSTLADPPADKVLADIRELHQRFWSCKQCDRIYWQGGHTKRMLARLEGLNNMRQEG